MKKRCCPLPKFNPVTHVIFDLDGTILDTEGIYNLAITEIGARYGKTYTNEMRIKIAGSVETVTAEIAVREMNLPMSCEEFLQEFKRLAADNLPDALFMPGAESLIRHLHSHHIPIAIATSSPQAEMEMKTMKKREIFDLFDHVVCGSSDPEVKMGKPAPDIFLVCASRFPDHPKPAQCLVLEDAINGIRGALKAGMQAIIIPDEIVPYELWKEATLRLDSMTCMVPELFGLPPFGDGGGSTGASALTTPEQPSSNEGNDHKKELSFAPSII